VPGFVRCVEGRDRGYVPCNHLEQVSFWFWRKGSRMFGCLLSSSGIRSLHTLDQERLWRRHSNLVLIYVFGSLGEIWLPREEVLGVMDPMSVVDFLGNPRAWGAQSAKVQTQKMYRDIILRLEGRELWSCGVLLWISQQARYGLSEELSVGR
jgi:hypothetical protein